MNGGARFTEDIPQLAATASQLACRFCGACQNYHFLWPYLRLVGAPGSVDDGKHCFDPVFADFIASGRRRILIAGAADTGLLSMVARSVGQVADITVLDRCRTPLELCQRFADRWSLAIETLHTDLLNLSIEASFDTIFAHSTLSFVAPDQRLDVMRRLRRALRSDGQLVLRFRIKGGVGKAHLSNYRSVLSQRLAELLLDMRVPLPEPRESFFRRVEAYTAERHARGVLETSYDEVKQLIEAAGFAVQSITSIQPDHSAAFGSSTAAVSNRKFVAVAEPR